MRRNTYFFLKFNSPDSPSRKSLRQSTHKCKDDEKYYILVVGLIDCHIYRVQLGTEFKCIYY